MDEPIPDDLAEKRVAVHDMLQPMHFSSEAEFQRYWAWFQIQYETSGKAPRSKAPPYQQRTNSRCRCRRDATRKDRVNRNIRKRNRHANTLDCPATVAIVRCFRTKEDELPYAVRIERTRNWPLPQTHTHTAEWMMHRRCPSLMMYKSWRNPGTAPAERERRPRDPDPVPDAPVVVEESELPLPTLRQANMPVQQNMPMPAMQSVTDAQFQQQSTAPAAHERNGQTANERNVRALLDRELANSQADPPRPLRNDRLCNRCVDIAEKPLSFSGVQTVIDTPPDDRASTRSTSQQPSGTITQLDMPATTRSQTTLEDKGVKSISTKPQGTNKRKADSVKTAASKKQKTAAATAPNASKEDVNGDDESITINRAPVLELWGSCVAHSLYPKLDWSTCLSIGGAISTITAISKGRSIGAMEKPDPGEAQEKREKRREEQAELDEVEVMGFHLKLKDGAAMVGDKPKKGNEETLKKKYGDEQYEKAKSTFEESLKGWKGKEEELSGRAFGMYEDFRPTIPSGQKGWGRKGQLRLETVRSAAAGG